jgi:hypothetical protein
MTGAAHQQQPPPEPEQEEVERFLFQYVYRIGDETYVYFDYFRDTQEAERYFLVIAKTYKYIAGISITEMPDGHVCYPVIDGQKMKLYRPYKRSDYIDLVKKGKLHTPVSQE